MNKKIISTILLGVGAMSLSLVSNQETASAKKTYGTIGYETGKKINKWSESHWIKFIGGSETKKDFMHKANYVLKHNHVSLKNHNLYVATTGHRSFPLINFYAIGKNNHRFYFDDYYFDNKSGIKKEKVIELMPKMLNKSDKITNPSHGKHWVDYAMNTYYETDTDGTYIKAPGFKDPYYYQDNLFNYMPNMGGAINGMGAVNTKKKILIQAPDMFKYEWPTGN
ncbi:hypothetical protein [Lentilactobacillus sp. Marseille-Q4993]|uniref:hypothetical protein n=1 Tax=Lentilactobacillus sp. Marseille-Q4993 TaxID=3039492 RepID=UPI0024BBF9F0|nr:hypothetical protein [Lentilactobacillus sp. Marseille-Q4993]